MIKIDIINWVEDKSCDDWESDESSGAEQCPNYTYSNKSYH